MFAKPNPSPPKSNKRLKYLETISAVAEIRSATEEFEFCESELQRRRQIIEESKLEFSTLESRNSI